MPTLLPQDSNNHPIPALSLKDGAAHSISASSTASTRNSVAFAADSVVISLYADVPVYLAFGDATIDATTNDHYFPAGLYYDFAIKNTHVAVRAAAGNGTVYISEKE